MKFEISVKFKVVYRDFQYKIFKNELKTKKTKETIKYIRNYIKFNLFKFNRCIN